MPNICQKYQICCKNFKLPWSLKLISNKHHPQKFNFFRIEVHYNIECSGIKKNYGIPHFHIKKYGSTSKFSKIFIKKKFKISKVQ